MGSHELWYGGWCSISWGGLNEKTTLKIWKNWAFQTRINQRLCSPNSIARLSGAPQNINKLTLNFLRKIPTISHHQRYQSFPYSQMRRGQIGFTIRHYRYRRRSNQIIASHLNSTAMDGNQGYQTRCIPLISFNVHKRYICQTLNCT